MEWFADYVVPIGSSLGILLTLRQVLVWLLGRPNLELLEELKLEPDHTPGQVYLAVSDDQPAPERIRVTLVATNHGPAVAKECYLAIDQEYMEGNMGPQVGFHDLVTVRRMEPRSTARYFRTVTFHCPDEAHGICLNAWLIPKRGRAAGAKLYFQLGPEGLEFKHMVFRRIRRVDATKAHIIARLPPRMVLKVLRGRIPPFARLVRERRDRVRQITLEDVHPATAKERKQRAAKARERKRAKRQERARRKS